MLACIQNLTTVVSAITDMAGAHQNLNGLHDLTMPLSQMISCPWASTATSTYLVNLKSLTQPSTKI